MKYKIFRITRDPWKQSIDCQMLDCEWEGDTPKEAVRNYRTEKNLNEYWAGEFLVIPVDSINTVSYKIESNPKQIVREGKSL